MRKLFLIGAVTGLLVFAPAAMAKSGGKATGGVRAVTTTGTERQFDFNAHEKGAKGKVNYRIDDGSYFKGEVNCFVQMDANTVAFSGTVTKTNDPAFEFFIAWVQDNGEPGADDWVRVSPGVNFPCDTHVWTTDGVPMGERWAVTAGNLQVH